MGSEQSFCTYTSNTSVYKYVNLTPTSRAVFADTSTALTRRRRPPENFREVSIVPTAMDIVAVGGYDQGPFLRKNIVKGSYYNVEHYLDIQFRLLREDFLRPLREGIQLLMATPSDGKDDRLKDVRLYKNARILDPIFTSKGVRYKIKFDVSEFRRLEWENSKRLTYGSLLCLSKDNFKTFVFASVAERVLQDVRRVREMSLITSLRRNLAIIPFKVY